MTSPSSSSIATTSTSTSSSTSPSAPAPSSLAPPAPSRTRARGISSASTSTVDSSVNVPSKRQGEFEKYFGDILRSTLPASASASPASAPASVASVSSSSLSLSLSLGKSDIRDREPDDFLEVVATQSADLQAKILIHGRLYLTRYHLCFRANILGFKTVKIHPLDRVMRVEKGTTAKWIQNAVYVVLDNTGNNAELAEAPARDGAEKDGGVQEEENDKEREVECDYGSLGDRDAMFDSIMACWQARSPDRYEAYQRQLQLERQEEAAELAQLDDDDDDDDDTASEEAAENGNGEESLVVAQGQGQGSATTRKELKHTQCSGEHFEQEALDTKFAVDPEKLFELMYRNKEFILEFYVKDKKLTDVEISEWHDHEGMERRDLTYVMHMNNAIGPSKSDCIGSETIHVNGPDAHEIVSETQTPDVPSGKNFKIHTRTCLTHDSLHGKPATRMYVTTQCDWSASSFLKGTITSAVIKGQKEYHQQVTRKIRAWIKAHPEQFGKHPSEVAAEGESAIPLAGEGGTTKVAVAAGEDGTTAAVTEGSDVTAPIVDEKKLLDNAINSKENMVLLALTALVVFVLTMWASRTWYAPQAQRILDVEVAE